MKRYNFWDNSGESSSYNDYERERNKFANTAYLHSIQEIANKFKNASARYDQAKENSPDKVIACYELAPFYRYGRIVKEDLNQAICFYDYAAVRHHAGACYELAKIYLNGDQSQGINQNESRAIEYIDLGRYGEFTVYNTSFYKQAEYVALLSELKSTIDARHGFVPKTITH